MDKILEFRCNKCGCLWCREYESELAKDIIKQMINLAECPACCYT